jgi:hypothetical protein
LPNSNSTDGRVKFKVGTDGRTSLRDLEFAGGIDEKVLNQLPVYSSLDIDEKLDAGIYAISPHSTIEFKNGKIYSLNALETATIIHTVYTNK